ncbi:LIM and calponin homology domains-containing protein 1 isoform 3-T3 [Spinachia spinachia]
MRPIQRKKVKTAVTGRCFGDKDFRGALENGILLCELLSSIKPGLVKKINRLPTPIAGLDNLSVFLCGCEELGLKGSQLFDPGDLQDTSTRPTAKGSDCSRRIKNVVTTIYWLGRAANGCTSYNGPTLDLKEFEGLLSQMRKEAEEAESPVRSIRDSGYIDCWDSERSDSLSPPRHGREGSFDSLDSLGSRSRQTPSPDVLAPPRGGSDGSDSESDGPAHRKLPDVRKDDMSARRTSVSEPRTAVPFNQYLPNRSNQSGYVPAPLRRKAGDKEEAPRKSWSAATSPVGGDGPFSSPARSCSEELLQHPSAAREGAERDDVRPRQALTAPKQLATPSPPRFLPVPDVAAGEMGRRKGRALSESDDPQRGSAWVDGDLAATFSHTHSVSCDPQSVSMIDMRGEEEAALQPHSHVRHELMHNQYNRMKEEDDHWQDDLARWKNRRRSISQDLIKKEEERKTMEQLMTGGTCTSQRRRSIKTYREIVEEKERREGELRDAYRRARSQEEASLLLQRYAQRFSISETALERLQLPKLLDRSVSADPSVPLCASPAAPDPDGPMRYLRQQSAPAPKFTTTLEARIEEFPRDPPQHQRPQIRSRSSEPSSDRTPSPKPVPLLTPTPYFQPGPSKAAGLLPVNGDVGRDDGPAAPEGLGGESPPDFQGSASKTSNSPADASPARGPPPSTAGPNPVEPTSPGVPPGGGVLAIRRSTPPASLPSELREPEEGLGGSGSRSLAADERSDAAAEAPPPSAVQSGVVTPQRQPVTFQESVPRSQDSSQTRENVPRSACPGSLERPEFANSVRSPLATSNPKLRREFFVPPEEVDKDRRANEKYRREQEKLKEEWERAQREVAEEERKYHEEERRILEETVAPLTPRPSALTPGPPEPREREQELPPRRTAASSEGAKWNRRDGDGTGDDSTETARSSESQPETLGHAVQNGQKRPAGSNKTSTPGTKREEASAGGGEPERPAGDRRVGPIDNNMCRSSSKKPAACPPPADTESPAPNRSVSGKKLCSSCGQPLGKGAAMIIETLGLYFHIHCFKCGVCHGQLGDTTTGTDVRIRNGLLNCHQCYIRSRSAGQPTTL